MFWSPGSLGGFRAIRQFDIETPLERARRLLVLRYVGKDSFEFRDDFIILVVVMGELDPIKIIVPYTEHEFRLPVDAPTLGFGKDWVQDISRAKESDASSPCPVDAEETCKRVSRSKVLDGERAHLLPSFFLNATAMVDPPHGLVR